MLSLTLFAIAAPFVAYAQQVVHQVTVGSSNGTLAFTPEAIVSLLSFTMYFEYLNVLF